MHVPDPLTIQGIRERLSDKVIYELTYEVVNPNPDRRYKRDVTTAPMIFKGTKFVVWLGNDAMPSPRLEVLPEQRLQGNILFTVHHALFADVMRALEPATIDLKTVIGYCNKQCVYLGDLLLMLVESGKVTLDDLFKLAEAWQALDEETQEKMLQQHGFDTVS